MRRSGAGCRGSPAGRRPTAGRWGTWRGSPCRRRSPRRTSPAPGGSGRPGTCAVIAQLGPLAAGLVGLGPVALPLEERGQAPRAPPGSCRGPGTTRRSRRRPARPAGGRDRPPGTACRAATPRFSCVSSGGVGDAVASGRSRTGRRARTSGGLLGVVLLEVAGQVGPGQPGRRAAGRRRAAPRPGGSGRRRGRPPRDTPSDRPGSPRWPAAWLSAPAGWRGPSRAGAGRGGRRPWPGRGPGEQGVGALGVGRGDRARRARAGGRRRRGRPRRGGPCGRRPGAPRPRRGPAPRRRRSGRRPARRRPARTGAWPPSGPSGAASSAAARTSRAASSLPASRRATPRIRAK